MEDVNCFLKARDVNDSEFIFRMNSDFTNTRANCCHGFPVRGVKTPLQAAQLITDLLAGEIWEFLDNLKRGPDPFERFRERPLYKRLYVCRDCR